MPKTNNYAEQRRKYKMDSRNNLTPYKIIASGIMDPQRFANERLAMEFFNAHPGRCLLTYNTNYTVKFLAYKFE